MIYCFDLDGTLVTNTEDENGNMHYTEAKPIPEAINRLIKLYESGHKIIIQTARGSKTKKFAEYTKLTEDHLEKFGIPYHQLIVGYKPSADLYIDDKAINVKYWLKSD